ncbi:hypothetical protein PENCOP_c003G05540 [Penicillium coprophilum]|uniref:Uncharacterized protein n=1 Tax=Penicillium coprophilum TaxID=36646 RepID=A0A1V6UXD3_9EURO|nr:hypothetical protein PENCOP_c003G05540 [Penicillium coprophilum]
MSSWERLTRFEDQAGIEQFKEPILHADDVSCLFNVAKVKK